MKRKQPEPEPQGIPGWVAAAGGLTLVVGIALVFRCTGGDEPPITASALAPRSSASAYSSSAPRCRPVTSGAGYLLGEKNPSKDQLDKVDPTGAAGSAAPAAPTDIDSDEGPDRDDLLKPFAVILGRTVPISDGFAFGLIGTEGGGNIAYLGTASSDGATGKTVKLLRLRGDLDPPVVAANPSSSAVYVAMLEPNASSRSIRMARVTGEEVAWGAEIPEDTDPSIAIDIAVTEKRGVVVWDTDDEESSYVHVAGFALDSFATITASRKATSKELAADSPRVVATKGGFFLAYLAHGTEASRDSVADRGKDEPPVRPEASATSSAGSKKKKKKTPAPAPSLAPSAGAEPGDIDEARGGESVSTSWVEVVPLDETGAQASDPIRVTPASATVVSFDVAAGPDGSILVAYRDDDAPTGGGGGVLHMASVHAGGVGATFESEDPVPSDGVPSLLAGWLAVPTLYGPDFIARLGPDGVPMEALTKEPSLGRGEPVAASGNRLLLTEPDGAAMRFRAVECGALPPPPKPVEPADD